MGRYGIFHQAYNSESRAFDRETTGWGDLNVQSKGRMIKVRDTICLIHSNINRFCSFSQASCSIFTLATSELSLQLLCCVFKSLGQVGMDIPPPNSKRDHL